MTVSVDTVNNIIIGRANSLSPLILGGPSTPAAGVNENMIIVLAVAMIGAGALIVHHRRVLPANS